MLKAFGEVTVQVWITSSDLHQQRRLSVTGKAEMTPQTLLNWVRQHERETGERAGLTTEESGASAVSTSGSSRCMPAA